MKIEEVLFEKYGPLVPLSGLALILDRSLSATRMFLRTSCNLARQLQSVKIKIGRKIYFRAVDIAKVLEGGVIRDRDVESIKLLRLGLL